MYGYQPVMVTANCIRKNTDRCLKAEEGSGRKKQCQKESGWLYLTDRYKKRFPVKNYCADCYNVIHNCEPLVLLQQCKEVRSLGAAELRMDLTVETEEEAERMIGLYWDCFKKNLPVKMPDMDYTKGHFRRGVK